MDIIRKKLLINSLQINFKYKKSIDGILLKFIKNEEKINTLKSSFDVFERLLHLIDTGDFFDHHFQDAVIEIWETLSNEQRQQILKVMVSDKKQFTSALLNSYVGELFSYSIGELLYDISFLNSLPGESEHFSLIRANEQDLDYDRIIDDDLLLDYYIKETDVFECHYNKWRNEKFRNFTEEQLKKLIEKGILWVIKSSQLKNDLDFIENIIMKYPNKVDEDFIEELPDNIKHNQRIMLALLLSDTENFDLLADKQTIVGNLYLLKEQDKHSKITNPYYSLDKKLYGLATMNDYFRNGTIKWPSGVDGRMILEILNKEEKNIFALTHNRIDEVLESKFEEIELLIDSNSIKNKKKFYEMLKINNEVLNLGVSNEQINLILNKNPNIMSILAKHGELGRIAANNLYYAIVNDTLDIFLDFCNLGIETKVNMSLIKRDLIEKVGYDIIRNASIYPESFYYLLMMDKNGKLDIYKQMLELVYNFPLDKMRISNILLYTYASYEKFIQQMIKNNEFTSENILTLINITQSFSLVDLNECNSIEEYYEKTNEFCDKNILSSINPLVSRELLSQRFFLSGYEQIIEFYNSFACSIDKINDPTIKNIFEIIKTLKDCEDIEIIKQSYKTLQQSNFKLDIVGVFALTEYLKKEIIGDYLIANTITNETKKNIIDFTGKEFSCLIHVIGAYGTAIPANNIYDSWNSNAKLDNTGICTSLLSENYFGHASTNKHSVILGFDNISPSEIQLMGPYDLYSNAYGLETVSGRNSKYYSSRDLVDNTRAHHNEVVINRNISNGQKRQPSYILCFDTINNESKKTSEEFGIPIVFIDVKRHLEIKMQEIENLKQSFRSTQSVDVMKKIINMQETMRCGLLANNKEIAQSLFNSDYITSNILFLIDNSKGEEVLNELEILLNNEKNRVIDNKDYRNVEFNGDLDLIFERLNTMKQKLSTVKKIAEFREVRDKQKQYDQVIREQQLSTITQDIVETRGGYSL